MSARSDSTRARIFEAAIQLISEKGVSATTVDEIVERAGVAKGTVYYHFKGKTELVEALIASELTLLLERFSQDIPASDDPLDRVMALVRAELEWIRDNRAFSKIFITEIWREDRMWRQTLVKLRQSIIARIRDAVQIGIDAEAFPAEMDPDFAASALFGLTATTALDWLVFAPERPIEFVEQQIEALVGRAVRAC